MKIKMTKTALGSEDGVKVQEYKKCEEYDVTERLYKAFVVKLKVAEPVNKVIEDIELKKVAVPENKALKNAPSNKKIDKTEEKEEEAVIIDVPEPKPTKKTTPKKGRPKKGRPKKGRPKRKK